MSVYLYDTAITERIRNVLQDPNIHIVPSEKMFTKSKDANDNPAFPAVSIFRPSYSLSTLNKSISGYRIGRHEYSAESNKLYATQTLPITINYQVDVWTKDRIQNDELVRELIWFYTLYPQQKLTLTYENYRRDFTFNCFVNEEITDNSNISEFEDKGQYYRTTFTLVVDEAQLFMVNIKPLPSIIATLEAYDMEGAKFDESMIEFNVADQINESRE